MALTVAAGAADLPRRTVAAAPAMPQQFVAAPAFTWTGFYAGGNIGFATRDHGFRFGGDDGDVFARGGIDPFVPLAGGRFGFVQNPGFDDFTYPTLAEINARAAAQNRLLIAPNLEDRDWIGRRGGDDDWNFTAGVQAGFNWQIGAVVVGVEGDVNWVGGRGGRFHGGDTGNFHFQGEIFGNAGTIGLENAGGLLPPNFGPANAADVDVVALAPGYVIPIGPNAGDVLPGGPAGTRYRADVSGVGIGRSSWVATARGRLGFTFDQFMVYGTAGFAFQDGGGNRTTTTTITREDFRPDVAVFDPGTDAVNLIPGERRVTTNQYTARGRGRDSVGTAYGLGVEWAAMSNISIGLEWVRADFRDSEIAFVDPILTAANDRRATRVPVQTDGAGNLVVRTPAQAGAAPEGVVRRAKIDDDVDMFKLKLNVRF